MATPAEIDEQIQLERDAISQGLSKLHKNTRDLEAKSYASATVYGAASIDTLLPLVVDRIQCTTNRIKEGKTGVSFKEIQQYLTDIEALAAASLAIKVTFDKGKFDCNGSSSKRFNTRKILMYLSKCYLHYL